VTQRVRRTFQALVAFAILATGALSKALTAEPGPATGLAVAGSALLLLASGSLALRILVVVARHAAAADRQRPPSEVSTAPSNSRSH
jgi:hypothetical protein